MAMGARTVGVVVAALAVFAVTLARSTEGDTALLARDADAMASRAVQASEAEEAGAGSEKHAAAIAERFDVSVEEALALHDRGIGWGAMVKLLAIAEAKGMSVEELLSEMPRVDGEYQFDFGELQKSLNFEQRQNLPKGMGHLKKDPPGLAKTKGVPPGLAKKEGVPPGLAKKDVVSQGPGKKQPPGD